MWPFRRRRPVLTARSDPAFELWAGSWAEIVMSNLRMRNLRVSRAFKVVRDDYYAESIK